MRWPSPSVCQSLDLEKETFWCDSCFPYKVYFLYIKDIWFALPKYVQINLSLTSSLARPPQLLSFFEEKTIHYSNFQSTLLKNTGFITPKACGLQDDVILLCLTSSTTPRRRNLLDVLAQYIVSHFRWSSWFLFSPLTKIWKNNITPSLRNDKNLLWGMLFWRRSRHSNEMTSLSILLAAVFLGIVSFFSTIAHGSSFCQYLPQCSWSLSKIYHSVFEIFGDEICMVRNTVTLFTYLETSDFGRLLAPTSCHFHCHCWFASPNSFS